MNCNIVVYSWTGNTAACATSLQRQLGVEAFLLVEEKEREGRKTFLSGGMQALFGMRSKVGKLPDVRDTDVLILGMPLWASTTPPAINTFLRSAQLKRGAHVYAFVTQQSSNPPTKLEKKLKKSVSAMGGQFHQLFVLSVPPKKTLCVEEAASHTQNWANQVMIDMSV